MKRLLAFVAATNQVLLFFGLLGGLGLLGYALYDEFRPRGPEGVPVRSATEAPAPPKITSVDFVARNHGYFIFGIRKDYVGKDVGDIAAHAGKITSSSYYGGMGSYLNMMFSDGTSVRRHLLPQDGVVLRHALVSDDEEKRGFGAHAFLCVLADTNNDGMLGYDDRAALIVVHPDLTGEDLRIEDVRDFDSLSRDQLLVETGTGAGTQFWIVDAATFTRREVAWK